MTLAPEKLYQFAGYWCNLYYKKIICKSKPIRLSFLMEQHSLKFSLFVEGATDKVSQFKIQIKSIYDKNFSFNEQNFFLNIAENLK